MKNKFTIMRRLRDQRAARRERERPKAVCSAFFGPTARVAVDWSPGGQLRGMTVELDHIWWGRLSRGAARQGVESKVMMALDDHFTAIWDDDALRVTFAKDTCPASAYGSGNSMLDERVRLIALSVAEDLSRLRAGRKCAEMVIDEQAIEGIEHVLAGLAAGDLRFVAARTGQLVRGVRDSLEAAKENA